MFQHTQRENEQHSQTLIQPSLEIGKEDDEHEKEANHVADKVMKMSDPDEKKEKMKESPAMLQKMGAEKEADEEKIQKMSESPAIIAKMGKADSSAGGMTASKNVEQGVNSSKGNGQSLPEDTQQELGTKMNADFSGVKIHTDEKAVHMNEEVSSKAFTHGNDIYFNQGQYNPSSSQGKHLLAHELTHTVQQGASGRSLSSPSNSSIQKKIIQRNIKENDMDVGHGKFSIDFTKHDLPPGPKAGEEGMVKFKPNAVKTSPNTKEIGLIQIIKNTMIDAVGAESDYTGWQGDAADINSMKTADKFTAYTSKDKDTLKTIAESEGKGQVTPIEIYTPNKAALGAFDPDKDIPAKTELKIPKVQANYSVDHLPSDPKAAKRTKKTDADVPLFYRDYAPNTGKGSQDGYKKSEADIQEASLWDFPGQSFATDNSKWDFETVARSKDKGFDYGTIHWGFQLDFGIIKNEYHSVAKGTSGTFKAAIAEFDNFYANNHIVVKGDTLYSIAELYLGDGGKWKDIQAANGLKDESISVGQKLIIPNKTATAK